MTNAEEDAKQQKRLERRLDTVSPFGWGCLAGCLPLSCFAILLPLPLLFLLN